MSAGPAPGPLDGSDPGFTRDGAMEARVARALEDAGVAPAEVARVRAALALAMEPRRAALPDPHHPEYLHPGRTVLILFEDAGVRDGVTLAAGALVDSERPALRVADERVRAAFGDAVADRRAEVPLPGAGLAEALVTARREACLVALVERLDHARHAKFWPDLADRRRILEEAEGVYGPVAARTDDLLARRFAHWTGAFRRSLDRAVARAAGAGGA